MNQQPRFSCRFLAATLLLVSSGISTSSGEDESPETKVDEPARYSFISTSGRTFEGAEVAKVEDDGVTFRTPNGEAKLSREEIPSETLELIDSVGLTLKEAQGLSLVALRTIAEREWEAEKAPLLKLGKSYEGHLQKLAEQFQASGDLESLLLTKAEMDSYVENRKRNFAKVPELKKAREIFDREREALTPAIVEKRSKTMKLYLGKLQSLTEVLTRNGELEKALETSNEGKRVETLMEQEQLFGFNEGSSAPAEPLWFLKSEDDYIRVGPIEITHRDSGWLLEKGPGINTQLGTNRTFSPPFEIVARIQPETDSSVRLLFAGSFLVQFNTGSDRDTLILFGPNDRRLDIPGQGELKPNRSHLVEIRVHPDRIEAYVEGEKRGEMKADFSDLNEIVSISPYRDCPILVEQFEIWPIRETKGTTDEQ